MEIFRRNRDTAQGRVTRRIQFSSPLRVSWRPLVGPARRTDLTAVWKSARSRGRVDGRHELLHELMAVFDELPAALRDAINYAPDPLNPKELAALCRRHGAANVLAMIELRLQRRARPADGDKRG